MALISLNLAIFNLLPIPILDGGLMLMLLVESVMRRDIKQEVKERVYQAAFVFLVLFAAVVIFNDFSKTNPLQSRKTDVPSGLHACDQRLLLTVPAPFGLLAGQVHATEPAIDAALQLDPVSFALKQLLTSIGDT